jgi:hypothetical protein
MHQTPSLWLIILLMGSIPCAYAGKPSAAPTPAPQQSPAPSNAPQPSDKAPSTDNNHPKQGEDSKTSFNQTLNILGAVGAPVAVATMSLGYWLTREHDDILEPDHLKEDAAALHSYLKTQQLDAVTKEHLDTALPHLDALAKAPNLKAVQEIEKNADHGKLAEAFTTLAQHIPPEIKTDDVRVQGRAQNLRDHYKARASKSASKTKT